MEWSEYTLAARQIAQQAGTYVLHRAQGRYEVSEKVSPYDFVTDVDKKSEQMIRDYLQERFPSHHFAGEESGMNEAEMKQLLTAPDEDAYWWVVDPLDGTVNYIHSIVPYAVSVALMRGGKTISGAVYLPATNELFFGERGKGAYLNEKRLCVSDRTRLKDALISASVPSIRMDQREQFIDQTPGLVRNSLNLRLLGSCATAIAFVAAGRLDAHIDIGCHPWDIAAGMLLVEEAGGRMTNRRGEVLSVADGAILISNGAIHEELYDTLQGASEGKNPNNNVAANT